MALNFAKLVFMNKAFQTQPALFVASAELNHPSLYGLDGAEAVLDWTRLETLMKAIYSSKTGRPSYTKNI